MRNGGAPEQWKMVPLAPEPTIVFDAGEADGISLSSPSIEVLPNGRIVVSMDQYGPGVVKQPGKKGKNPHFKHWLQGKVFTSNDRGRTWDFRETYPFSHARLFRDGHHVCMVGDSGSVQASRSADGGTTWTAPEDLTSRQPDGDSFIQSPTEVLRANGSIYMVAMRITDFGHKGYPGSTLSAVVMRAAEGANVLTAKNWTFSEPSPPFREFVPEDTLDHFGVPFFRVPRPDRGEAVAHRRWAYRIGWHDAHIVQIKDPAHYWHDPSGKTFHVLACAATHRSNFAALARVREDDAGAMTFSLERTPAGRKVAFVPLPGGNMKFHVLYDDVSGLFWLASNQMRDSMTRVDKLPGDRQDLPCDEDRRLQLHFSTNLVDWCFAGCVNGATEPGVFRFDPAMAVRGNDLCIVSLAGKAAPGRSHQASQVLLYTIPDFRELVY